MKWLNELTFVKFRHIMQAMRYMFLVCDKKVLRDTTIIILISGIEPRRINIGYSQIYIKLFKIQKTLDYNQVLLDRVFIFTTVQHN
jgi:hypothetical protein